MFLINDYVLYCFDDRSDILADIIERSYLIWTIIVLHATKNKVSSSI